MRLSYLPFTRSSIGVHVWTVKNVTVFINALPLLSQDDTLKPTTVFEEVTQTHVATYEDQ